VILGSTGESVFVSDEESEKLVQAAREAILPGKKILVGTARESTLATLKFTNRIAGLDIDAALIRTPSYFKSQMSSESLREHYVTIADQSKIPVIIYNIPQRTGISIGSDLLIELSSHPNIIGIKDSSGNLAFLGEVFSQLDPQFIYLLGAGSLFLPGLLYGACGGILALADLAPAECSRIYELYIEERLDEALDLQLKLVPLNRAIIQTYGIPAIKYALDLIGFYGGPPRRPLLPIQEKGQREMKDILDKLGIIKK
jgi:4-hydroxy-2-oxoglutarate aldolase